MRCLRSLHVIGCIFLALLTYWHFVLREIVNRIIDQSNLTNVSILFYSSLNEQSPIKHPSCYLNQIDISVDLDSSELIFTNISRITKKEIKIKNILRTIQNYSAVIFHSLDMPSSDILRKISHLRPKGQLWAYHYHNDERSGHAHKTLQLKAYDGIFNLTITPRSMSDIVLSRGYFFKKSFRSQPWRIEYIDIFEKPHSIPIESERNLANMNLKFEERDLSIAWIPSNCNMQRDWSVGSLLRHLPIHIYGKCSAKYGQNRVCEKNTLECELLLRRYKFILIENSICNDYVSEKYHNAIFRGNIPIVYGGSDLDAKGAIHGSYVDIRRFESIKQLAAHVRKVLANEEEYMKYFRWRDTYYHDFIPRDRYRLDVVALKLCDRVRAKKWSSRGYNISQFHIRGGNCTLQV